MSNRGFIDAIYSITIPNTSFGKCFIFEPNESLISPSGFQAIRITFKSNKLGSFKEIFEFAIDGNPVKSPLEISGNIIAPTFNFDVPKIKFGLVSFG
jgi:hydrocephalus-inducing protein